MAMEVQRSALWWGRQSAKGTENTTPAHRGYQVAGDFALNRDIGSVQVSDGSKYGSIIRYINSLSGAGTPGIEATPSELASLLWLAHGGETFVAGTNNVQTLTAGTATGGTLVLKFWDGIQTITVSGVPFNVTAAALDTSFEAALAAAGYAASQVTVGGGPLNTTPITITFNGTQTAARPFALMTVDSTGLTGGTGPAVTNTTPGVRAKHTFNPSATAGHWTTFVKSVGTGTVQRHSMIDCLIGGFTLESSQAQKDMRITPNLLSLDPYKVIASDPAAVLPTGVDARPFIYTEGSGAFTLGTGSSSTVISGQSAVTLTVDENRSPAYGDDVVPYDFAVGTPTVAVSITFIFDGVGLARWNELIYGTAAPTAGTKPLRNLPSVGSYAADWKQKDSQGNVTGNETKVTIPAVNWDVPAAPAPNPSGGLAEVTLAGAMQNPGGATQPYTIDVFNADNAAYTA
jgi:hypothetical protein